MLDPNVLVSAVLSPNGTPAAIMRQWLDGAFELVVSPALLDELERVLDYSKLRKRVTPEDAAELLTLLREDADLRPDHETDLPVRPSDPDDEYLVALAASSQAVIVTGDRALLELADRVPVYSPAGFLEIVQLATT